MFEKVETSLGGWQARCLSRRGCLVLLKAVLVDLQDADRHQEMSREDHAELILARFQARGVTRGSARRVDYRVPARVSRWARHSHLQYTNISLLIK